MWGRRPEQRSLRCTCFTFICCLMHLNSCLIEFISIQILLGLSSSGDTVTTVFMDSPALQFVLNYLCSTLQQRGGLLTVPGIGLVFTVEEVIAGIDHHTEVKTLTTIFHWRFEDSLSLVHFLCLDLFFFIVVIIFFLLRESLPKRDNEKREMQAMILYL